MTTKKNREKNNIFKILLSNNFTFSILLFFSLLIVGFFYWRLKFNLFYWDEWDWVIPISQNSFNLLEPHNEHLLPISKALYLLLINLWGSSPNFIQYFILLLHILTSFIFGNLSYLFFKKKIYYVGASLIFLLHPFQWENVLWGFQSQIIMNVALLFLSIMFLKLFLDKANRLYYALSAFFIFSSAYTFGNGLIYPLILILLFLILRGKKHKLVYVLPYIVVLILNTCIYLVLSNNSTDSSFLNILNLNAIKDIFQYFIFAIGTNFSRSITLINNSPLLFYLLINPILILLYLMLLINNKKNKVFVQSLLLGGIIYITAFLLTSLSRYEFGVRQSNDSRYTYFYLGGVIFLIIPVFEYYYFIFRKYIDKKILISLLGIVICIFLFRSIRKVTIQKEIINERNANNYLEMDLYGKNAQYVTGLSRLHPFRTNDELLSTFKYYDLITSTRTQSANEIVSKN